MPYSYSFWKLQKKSNKGQLQKKSKVLQPRKLRRAELLRFLHLRKHVTTNFGTLVPSAVQDLSLAGVMKFDSRDDVKFAIPKVWGSARAFLLKIMKMACWNERKQSWLGAVSRSRKEAIARPQMYLKTELSWRDCWVQWRKKAPQTFRWCEFENSQRQTSVPQLKRHLLGWNSISNWINFLVCKAMISRRRSRIWTLAPPTQNRLLVMIVHALETHNWKNLHVGLENKLEWRCVYTLAVKKKYSYSFWLKSLERTRQAPHVLKTMPHHQRHRHHRHSATITHEASIIIINIIIIIINNINISIITFVSSFPKFRSFPIWHFPPIISRWLNIHPAAEFQKEHRNHIPWASARGRKPRREGGKQVINLD